MADKLVLLTGATGHVGFGTLKCLLEHGYTVRAAVRSETKAEAVRNNPAIKHIESDQLSFVTVPDMLVDGAFDEAVKDCKYVVHVASPVPDNNWTGEDDLDTLLVKPAVQCTLGLFASAKEAGTVKRIVITSSAVAVVPMSAIIGGGEITEPFTADTRSEEIPAPYMNNVMVAYVASKIAALNRGETWIAKEKPAFDVIHIHPSYVLGRDDMTTSIASFQQGTNANILDPLLGKKVDGRTGSVVHLDDVALAHVRALDSGVKGNQSFFLTNNGTEGMKWDDAKDIAKKHFPKAVEDGTFPCDGSVGTTNFKADVTKTEKVLGIKLKSYEEMVVSVAGHYLEILEKEKPK